MLSRRLCCSLLVLVQILEISDCFSLTRMPPTIPLRQETLLLHSSLPPDAYQDDILFESLGLSREVLSSIWSQPGRWEVPTPIQRLAIPRLLDDSTTCAWCEAPLAPERLLHTPCLSSKNSREKNLMAALLRSCCVRHENWQSKSVPFSQV